MKAFIGLGNPGSPYQHTRHNMGFLVMDALAKHWDISFRKKTSLRAEVTERIVDGEKIFLCKPQTFMNASGDAVRELLHQSSLTPQDLLVIYDDADLPFGDLRLKPSGSSAGHNGMQSVLEVFPRSTSVARLRVGIGRPAHPDTPLDVWVLQPWSAQEKAQLPDILERAVKIVLDYLSQKTA
jgi:PTH1 family peptidyl-tRNA hydrolase